MCATQHNCYVDFGCNAGGTPCDDVYQYSEGTPGDYQCGTSDPGGDQFTCKDNFDCTSADSFDCSKTTAFRCGNGKGVDSFSCASEPEVPTTFNCMQANGFGCAATANFQCYATYNPPPASGFGG